MLLLAFFLFYLYFHVCVCMCACEFFLLVKLILPSTIWFPGIELELSGLGAGTFTYWAISPTSCVVFNLLSFCFACHSLPLLIISNLKWYLSLFRREALEKETDHSNQSAWGSVLHPHKKRRRWREGEGVAGGGDANGREERGKSQQVAYCL